MKKAWLTLTLVILMFWYHFSTPASMEASAAPNTMLFATGFETDPQMELSYNGSLPLGTPGESTGWTTSDIDSSLYPNDTIVGPARVWIVRDATKAYHGEASAKFWAGRTLVFDPNWDTTRYSLLMKAWWVNQQTPTALTELYVRWYQKFEVLPSTFGQALTIFNMLGVSYSGDVISNYYVPSAVVKIVMDNNMKISFSKLWNNSAYSTSEVPLNFETNRWYCFEVFYKSDSSNGEYRLWLDGQETVTLTGVNSVPPAPYSLPNSFEVGLSHSDTDPSSSYTAWVDSVVAADYRVGPEEVEPTNKLTATIQVFDNSTRSHVANAFVNMGSYQGYTDESGLITFSGITPLNPYRINITKLGYQTLTGVIDFYDSNQSLSFYLQGIPKSKGSLEVAARKSGESVAASVEIIAASDSSSKGSYVTPFTVNLETGTYTLKATYDSFTQTESVTVTEGQTTFFTFDFEDSLALPSDIQIVGTVFIIIALIAGIIFAIKEAISS